MDLGNCKNEMPNIHALIEKQVKETPDRVAVETTTETLTYKELWEESGKVANYLTAKGIVSGDVVGIVMGRCKELMISVLGVMRVGGIFILIDSNAPVDRIQYMIEDSGAKVLLVKELKKEYETVSQLLISEILLEERNSECLLCYRKVEDTVYILYTSGSTGKPKGVQVVHRGLTNYITWAAGYYCKGERLNFPLFSAVSFDLTITSIFTPLITGAKIIVFEEDDIDLVRKVVRHKEIDVVKLTPSHLNMITEEDIKESKVRKFILGGEALKCSVTKRIHDWYQGNIEIYNEYGPTEATVGCMIYQYNPEKDKREVVPIGIPIQHTQIFILDNDRKPVAYGVAGEIYIGGYGLAKGYLNKEEQTKQSFIESPFRQGQILYKTGDLAKVIPGKIIEYIGRKDEQVKLRGYRIELGEIENVILKQQGVKDATVVIHEENGTKRLCAYLVASESLDLAQMKDSISRMLPNYMVPDYMEVLEDMPVTANGKVDKGFLKKKEINCNREKYVMPTNDIEKKLVQLWQDMLHKDRVGVRDNFFDLGGNSLLIVQLCTKMVNELHIDCQVTELFAYPTIQEFVAYKYANKPSEKYVEKQEHHEKPHNHDVAIIGIGVNMPHADNLHDFWKMLSQEHDFIGEFPNERKAQVMDYIKDQAMGEDYLQGAYLENIDTFDAQFFGFSPVEADIMDPNQRIFLETCWRALEDAGYAGDALYGSDTGVFLGYGSEADYRKMVYKYNNESINAALAGTLPSITSSRISYYLNLTGPAVNFDTACSSSLVALHYACQSLYMQECEQALVGGVKIQLFPVSHGVDIGISSSDSRTKTFDNKANGTVGGEGSIALLIKPLEKALEQKDHIYAVIKGSAINQDGKSNGITAPNPIAQTKVIKKAWEKAQVDPETISYIEAHGTGTRLGDPIEIDGITKAFRAYTDKRQFCAIGSIKSNIGHLDNVAGLAGVLKAALCLKHKKLLPNLHFDEPNEQISFIDSPVYVSNKYCDWEVEKGMPRRCGISAFGMSGTNCHIIMEEPPEVPNDLSDNSDFCVLCISAESQYSFRRLLKMYTHMLKNVESFHELKRICYTTNIGRGNYRYRIAVILKEGQDYRIDLNNYNDNSESDTIFYGEHVLVAATKERRGKAEITNEELVELNSQADRYCKAFLEGKQEKEKLLIAIAKLYVKGCNIDWKTIMPEQIKVSLPTYPFKKERHWVSIPNQIAYYTKEWVEDTSYLDRKVRRSNEDKKLIAVILNHNEVCRNIVRDQLAEDYEVLPIYIDYKENEERLEEVIFEQITDMDWKRIEKIVHICDLAKTKPTEIRNFKKSLMDSAMSLIFVIRYVANVVENMNLYVITKNVTSNQESAILCSIIRTISLEYTNISCLGLELDEMSDLGLWLQGDIEHKNGELAIQVAQKKCYKHIITKAEIDNRRMYDSLLTNDGVYVIWGGTGNIGLKVAEFLLEKVDGIHIALIGRTEVSSLHKKEKLSKLLYEENNLKVYKADISDEVEVTQCMQLLEREYKKINGLFFCAAEGVGGTGHPIKNLSETDFWDGIKAKTGGLFLLESLSLQEKMDFMVLFSSVITSTGSYGDVAYSASNACLDSFANKESKIAKRVLTIDWPTWISTIKETVSDSQANLQMYQPITDKDALENLWNILHSGLSGQVIIGEINHNPAILFNLDKAKCEFEESIIDELQDRVKSEQTQIRETLKTEQNIKVNLEGKEEEAYTKTEMIIGTEIGKVLGYQNVDVYRSFVEMGINSILFVQLQLKLEEKNIYVEEKDFYKYDTVYGLAAFLEDNRVEESKKETTPSKIKEKIYNDIFYKSCFYHSLFTLMRLEDRDINPYYCNDIFCYEYQNGILNIRTISNISEDEILMEQNIPVQKREIITTDELIAELKDNKKAIIWIDCYYEPIRTEMYHKQHLAHTLAITDYDEDAKQFLVIEHSGANNMDYQQCKIGKQDLERCIQGFSSYDCKDKGSCHYIMDFLSDKKIENEVDYPKQYQNLWRNFTGAYARSIEDLKKFIEEFSTKDVLDEKDFQDMSSMVSNIVKYKAIDVYRNRIFEIEGNVASATEEVYESWKRIRNSLVRMNLCREYEVFNQNVFIEQLNSIVKLELQLVSELETKIY